MIEEPTRSHGPPDQFAQVHKTGLVFGYRWRQVAQRIVHQLTTCRRGTLRELGPRRLTGKLMLQEQCDLVFAIVEIYGRRAGLLEIGNCPFEIPRAVTENRTRWTRTLACFLQLLQHDLTA